MMRYNPTTGEVCDAVEPNRTESEVRVVMPPPISEKPKESAEKPRESVEKSASKYSLVYHIFHF